MKQDIDIDSRRHYAATDCGRLTKPLAPDAPIEYKRNVEASSAR